MGRRNSQKGHCLRSAITIGNFDGVHRGHVYLLERFKSLAEAMDLRPVVISFYGHPKVFKETPPLNYLLTTSDERKQLMYKIGIKSIEFVKLDREIMMMRPEEFIKTVLIGKYNMEMLFMGFNHHFGRNREGTPQHVSQLVSTCGFMLVVVPPFLVHNKIVSSTLIRNLLKSGKVEEARTFLGREYKICGKVAFGKKLAGSVLGIKTANVELSPLKLIPASGTYAVWVDTSYGTFPGALYIGNSPTIKNEFSFEVHIIGFEKDIYGEEICVRFVKRIRDNKKFESIHLLRKEILRDIEESKRVLEVK